MAAPTLVGLGTLFLARTGLKLRTRAPNPSEDVETGVGLDGVSKPGNGSVETPEEVGDVSAVDTSGTEASMGETNSPYLAHGTMICLVGPEGELMGVTTSSAKTDEMSLLPISTIAVESGSSKRIQSYPSHSIFIVIKQEHDISFCSVSAAGMMLEASKDATIPHKVSARKPTKYHTWRLTNGDFISNATGERLSLKPQLLHGFAVDEMRDRERAVNNRERQLQAEINYLRDRLRKDASDHKELAAKFAEEKHKAETTISGLHAQVEEQEQLLKEVDDDCRRKGALLKQLEARLADISMGSDDVADGQGAMSDIVRHWQAQVAAAEERAVNAGAHHAEQIAAVRDEHMRAMAALKQEHSAATEALQAHAAAAEERAMAAAEAKQLSRLGEAEPAVAALQARTTRQGDKIRQQNDVIRELASEVERLSDVERELLEEVRRLSYADHALTNISRSIVEATTPRDQAITVPRNPWQDRETQHERLVRQSSLASSLSGRSRPHTADTTGAEGRPQSSGRARRLSAGDPAMLRESLKARRLSATSEAAVGIAVAREAIARSTAQWPSPPRPHMPTSLVPQTSVPEGEPLFAESSGRPASTRSAGSSMNFASAFAEVPASEAVESSALTDSTNSPRARRRPDGWSEAHLSERDTGPTADENAPHRDVGGALAQRQLVGAQGRRRVGMGQADVELSKSAKEEMSVLQHNTRVLSSGHKRRLVQAATAAAGDPAAVHEGPVDAQSETGSTVANSLPSSSSMRRSVSLGNKPRPPALDLTCIPDLMPDASDLAAAPAHAAAVEAGAVVPPAADETGTAAVHVAAPPAAKEGAMKQGAQAVVRTPVAQRVLRMNKLSKAQEFERQPSGSDLSRASSSIPAPRSGLHRTHSSTAASGKAAPEAPSAVAPARTAATGLRRSLSGTSVLPRRPASTEDLRQSVESTGLKVHAARTAALGYAGRNWTARPPTAPSVGSMRPSGGKGALHQQCASNTDSLQAASIEQPFRRFESEELVDDTCNVHDIANKFSSPEKSHISKRGDSPRWSRNRTLGTRSRHAKRALGVFPSRSFSAGASGASLSSKMRTSAATQASVSGLSHHGFEPISVDDDSNDQMCSRRLSMDDPRVSRPGPAETNFMEAPRDESFIENRGNRQVLARPMFLHRNAVQSIDVKPW